MFTWFAIGIALWLVAAIIYLKTEDNPSGGILAFLFLGILGDFILTAILAQIIFPTIWNGYICDYQIQTGFIRRGGEDFAMDTAKFEQICHYPNFQWTWRNSTPLQIGFGFVAFCALILILVGIVHLVEISLEWFHDWNSEQKRTKRYDIFRAQVLEWMHSLEPYKVVHDERINYAWIATAKEIPEPIVVFHFKRLPLFTVASIPDKSRLHKTMMYQSVAEFMISGKREAIYIKSKLSKLDYCAVCLAIEEHEYWFGIKLYIEDDKLVLRRIPLEITLYESEVASSSVEGIENIRTQIANLKVGEILSISPNIPLSLVRAAAFQFSSWSFASNKSLNEPPYYAGYWGDSTVTLLQRLTDD